MQGFTLDLTDELIDLSAKFRVIVNGHSQTIEKQPSLRLLYLNIQNSFDANRLFTVEYSATVESK